LVRVGQPKGEAMTAIVASSGAAAGGGALIVILIVISLYFLPTIIAASRKVPNIGSVIVVNLFLGWTFIGWVVALAMAMRSRLPNATGASPTQPANPAQPPSPLPPQESAPEPPAPREESAAALPPAAAGDPAEYATATVAMSTPCPNGHPVPIDASFCPSCGSPVAVPPSS
jgi:Superinfection immunity protein